MATEAQAETVKNGVGDSGANGGQAPAVPRRHRHKNKPLPKLRNVAGVKRRFNVVANRIAADIGRPLSLIERELTRQAAACLVRCEQLQAQLLRGEIVVADEMVRLTSEARRITASLYPQGSRGSPQPQAAPGPLLTRLREASGVKS
jgi:hypothetical protein